MSLKLNTSNKILVGSFFVPFHKMFSKEGMRERERERERERDVLITMKLTKIVH